MPYLGNIPATQFAELKYQDFTGGSGTSFTLNDPVGSAQELEVFVNNVRQEPGVAYTVSGTALTMTGSIVASDDFYVVFQGKSTGTATHPAGQALTATDGTFTGDLTVDTDTLHVDASADVVRVGKTSGGVTTDGWQLSAGASHYAIPSGQYFILNRTTSGAATMIDFRSENSSKGAINYNGTNVSFTSGSNNIFNQSGISFDNGSNYLDDYEEGTWTPALNTGFPGSPSPSIGNATYTKVGRTVHASCFIDAANDGTSLQIGGLPYASASGTNSSVSVGHETKTIRYERMGAGVSHFNFVISGTQTVLREFIISITYTTA